MPQPKEMSESATKSQVRIQRQLNGEPTLLGEQLTATELRLLELTLAGVKGTNLYDTMHLSKGTIEYHRQNIRDKLGASNMRGALTLYTQTIKSLTETPGTK